MRNTPTGCGNNFQTVPRNVLSICLECDLFLIDCFGKLCYPSHMSSQLVTISYSYLHLVPISYGSGNSLHLVPISYKQFRLPTSIEVALHKHARVV